MIWTRAHWIHSFQTCFPLLWRTALMGGRAYQNQLATALLEFMRCTTVTATPHQCPDLRNTSTDQVRGAFETRKSSLSSLLRWDFNPTAHLLYHFPSFLLCISFSFHLPNGIISRIDVFSVSVLSQKWHQPLFLFKSQLSLPLWRYGPLADPLPPFSLSSVF